MTEVGARTREGASVLVTGSDGFIGRSVVASLLALGAQVIRLRREGSRRVDDGEDGPLPSSLRSVHFDLNRPERLPSLPDDLDAVVHLAWGRMRPYDDARHVEHELPRQVRFLQAIACHRPRRILVAGTCFEYGLAEGLLPEWTPVRPVTAYATAKAKLHDQLSSYLSQSGESWLTWLRLFYVHGAHQPPPSLRGALSAAIARGDRVFPMSKGDQVRDYLAVERMGEVIAKIAVSAQREPSPEVLNVCSGTPVRILDLVREWVRESESDLWLDTGALPYPTHEPMQAWGDRGLLDAFLKSNPSPRHRT